jgi:Flp pilus assembly protein TadG
MGAVFAGRIEKMWNGYLLERWRRCQRGNIAVITGLMTVVLIVAFGMAIDYNRALDLRGRLQNAADFAVLSALNPANKVQDVERAAEDLFRSALAADDAPLVKDVKATLETNATSKTKKLSIAFAADMANNFMVIVGYDITPVGGTASANYGPSNGMRFHFLLDTSDSMGLVATPDGRARLRAATAGSGAGSCEFACHGGGSPTNLDRARQIGVTLRLDAAKMGVERVLDLANSENIKYSVSISSISSDLQPVIGVTDESAVIAHALRAVDVGYNQTDDANTLYNISLPQAGTWLDSIAARGSSELVILVTDGIQSSNRSEKSPVGLLDNQLCNSLKRNGRKLAVIYTEYLPVADHMYTAYVEPVHDQIESNLRACASPDLFEKGETPEEIIDAFELIFHKAPSMLYLSS